MKIFGREPALIIATVGAIVAFVVSLKVDWLTAGQGAAVVTFLTAVIIAATTRPVAPAMFTAIISAAAALVAQYGLHLSDATVGAVSGMVLAGFALLSRGQITPKDDPRPQAMV